MPIDARIRRRLKLRDLDTLITVAQHGSLAKAAKQLSVSQPAVSKAMSEMEHTLGVRLLDRTAQGIEPTLYGRALLKWAQVVFDDVRQGMNEIEFLADPAKGELRVGAAEPTLGGLLPAVIERIHRKHPMISIQVRPLGALAQIHRDLRERRVDLVLGRMAQSPEEDLENEILFYDRTLVVAGLNSPWTRRRKIKLAELTNELWSLSPPDTIIGMLVEEAFRANGLDTPRYSAMTSSIQVHSALLNSGRYLSTLPSSALHFTSKQLALKILPVDLGIPPWPIAITALKNRTESPVARVFLECAREVAKPLTNRKL
jgi:DNA-binding transcriptional LysR family regulator